MSDSSQKPERWALSVEETAGVLGLSQPSINRALKAKRIGSVKIGGRDLVPIVEINKVLAEASAGSGKAA